MDAELKDALNLLLGKIDGVRTDIAEIRSDISELRTDVTEIRSNISELRADVAALQSGQDELRRTTSANHFKLMGRISQVDERVDRIIGGKPAA